MKARVENILPVSGPDSTDPVMRQLKYRAKVLCHLGLNLKITSKNLQQYKQMNKSKETTNEEELKDNIQQAQENMRISFNLLQREFKELHMYLIVTDLTDCDKAYKYARKALDMSSKVLGLYKNWQTV